MTVVTADDSFECRCSWSRAWMLVCTSKIGPSKTYIASYIAMEVNEYAAELIRSRRLDQVDQHRVIVGLMKFGFHTTHSQLR